MSVGQPDVRRRVKLYALNDSRQWDDKGTGHVTSCYHEPLDGISLLVRAESDGSLMLESKIQLDTQYQKQQGTLIVWTESDNYDLALSFQEQDGCNEIWEKICQVQGKDPSYEHDNDEDQEEIRINLIDCDRDKLHLILEQITAFSQTFRRRDALAQEYIEVDYIRKLLDIFKTADQEQDLKVLTRLYEIFKQLFLYDRPNLTEAMISESNLIDLIGVFEYEPIEESPRPEEADSTEVALYQTDNNNDSDEQIDAAETDTSGEDIDTAAVTAAAVAATTNTTDTSEDAITDPVLSTSPDKALDVTDGVNEKDGEDKPATVEEEESATMTNGDTTSASVKVGDGETDDTDDDKNTTKDVVVENIKVNRKRHREYLLQGTTFKEVIPLGNQELVDKIHLTYRVQYLQTSVLPTPSILEENAYGSLTNILFFYKIEIVTMIQDNRDFLQSLFNQIVSNEVGTERKRELVLFLREYCTFSQTIQPKNREDFFKTLASLRVLSAVEVALSSSDLEIKSAAIDIFTYLVEYNPHMTRDHAMQQKEGVINPPNNDAHTANIMKLVIEHITTDQDPELGTATQLSCIIRLLLENEAHETYTTHHFLEFFYQTCSQSLFEPIKNSTTLDGDIKSSANDRKNAQLLSIMLELLTFSVEHHNCHLRTHIHSSDLLIRIISLIKSRHKFLVLSVIRFFRHLIATKDQMHCEYVMNKNLFDPIIQVLMKNNGRYNLVDSAILEMFEYIQSQNLIPLMNHILSNFGTLLDTIDYVNTIKAMREKCESYQHSMERIRPRSRSRSRSSSQERERKRISLADCILNDGRINDWS